MDKGLAHAYAEPDQVMKVHGSADMNEKSVQESGLLGHFSKSDVRYWQRAIFRQTYTHNGKTRLTKDWTMKIAHEGRRETFPLGTPLRRRQRSGRVTCISPAWRMAGNRP